MSNSLCVGADFVHCGNCNHALGPVSAPWKESAALQEMPISTLEGPYALSGEVLLREFICPGCGTILDAEVALPGDPLLVDQLA